MALICVNEHGHNGVMSLEPVNQVLRKSRLDTRLTTTFCAKLGYCSCLRAVVPVSVSVTVSDDVVERFTV